MNRATRPAALPSPNEPCWCGSGTKYKKCHKDTDAHALRAQKQQLEDGRVRQGVVSPRREVPAHIRRPDYAEHPRGEPRRDGAASLRTPEEVVRLRAACTAAARVLRETGERVKPGVTTDALDAFAHELTVSLGGYPSPLNYWQFPKSICTSPNEVICHGIPDSRPLKEGDIVNLDITVYLDGMHGDCNATFFVGEVDAESRRLVEVTRRCLELGIQAVQPGRPISDIGKAIETCADDAGYSVVRDYCGHGIGPVFHTALQIPHYFDGRSRTVMQPGMSFTIEPMINAGSWEKQGPWEVGSARTPFPDGWTALTADLKRSAQFEHTVLVTDTGVEVLTREPG